MRAERYRDRGCGQRGIGIGDAGKRYRDRYRVDAGIGIGAAVCGIGTGIGYRYRVLRPLHDYTTAAATPSQVISPNGVPHRQIRRSFSR